MIVGLQRPIGAAPKVEMYMADDNANLNESKVHEFQGLFKRFFDELQTKNPNHEDEVEEAAKRFAEDNLHMSRDPDDAPDNDSLNSPV